MSSNSHSTSSNNMSKAALKQRIVRSFPEFPELAQVDKWDVTDSDDKEDIHMIHAQKDTIVELPTLHGIVVSLRDNRILVRGYDFPTKIVSSLLVEDEKAGTVTVKARDGKDVTFNTNEITITHGFEPVTVRCFKYHGKVYRTTHKRLSLDTSHWGHSEKFGVMYEKLGGPKDEELFSPKFPDSPFVHILLMIHPSMTYSSNMNIGDGCVMYLDSQKMMEKDTPFPPNFETDYEIGFTYVPAITVADANKHIQNSDPKVDWRLGDADFIMIRQGLKLFLVQSPAYNWRVWVHGEEPNHMYRFHQLTNYAMDKHKKVYSESFPLMDGKAAPDTFEVRLWNVWRCLQVATSPYHHEELKTLYQDYLVNKAKVRTFLGGLVHDAKADTKNMYSRVGQIVNNVRTRTFHFRNTVMYNNKVTELLNMTVNNEEGGSFYRLIQAANGKRLNDLV